MTITKRGFSKFVCVLLVLTTLFSFFAMPMNASAANKNDIGSYRVSGVTASSKVTKTNMKYGKWYIYSHSASIKWNAISGADGYEIEWKSASWQDKKVTVNGTSYNFPGLCMHGVGATLKLPEYYNVRVRAYIIEGGRKYYSKWSYARTVWC